MIAWYKQSWIRAVLNWITLWWIHLILCDEVFDRPGSSGDKFPGEGRRALTLRWHMPEEKQGQTLGYWTKAAPWD